VNQKYIKLHGISTCVERGSWDLYSGVF